MKRIETEGVDVRYVEAIGGLKTRVAFYKMLKAILKEYKVDVVLCAYYRWCSTIWPLLRLLPTIIDIRSADVNPNKYVRSFYNKIMAVEVSLFTRIITVSCSVAEKLHLRRAKYDVVSLGSDMYCQDDKNYSAIRMLYVGTLLQRDIYKTVEGVIRFRANNPDVELHYDIVGFGPEKDEALINKLIEENNLSGIVEFHGRVCYDDLPPYYERANLGVAFVPMTPYYDCQPATKIYEYALSGLYCIATATSENKRLINADNGMLCEDTADSFYEALCKYNEMNRTCFDSRTIRNTMMPYLWENVIETSLLKVMHSVV